MEHYPYFGWRFDESQLPCLREFSLLRGDDAGVRAVVAPDTREQALVVSELAVVPSVCARGVEDAHYFHRNPLSSKADGPTVSQIYLCSIFYNLALYYRRSTPWI